MSATEDHSRLRWYMSKLCEGPCQIGPPHSPKDHLSCPIIVFILALTQQSFMKRAVWNDTGFHYFQTSAGVFIKQHSAWTFWTTNCFGFKDWLHFYPSLQLFCALLIQPTGSVTSRGVSSADLLPGINISPMHEIYRDFWHVSMTHARKNTLSPTVRKHFPCNFKALTLSLTKGKTYFCKCLRGKFNYHTQVRRV